MLAQPAVGLAQLTEGFSQPAVVLAQPAVRLAQPDVVLALPDVVLAQPINNHLFSSHVLQSAYVSKVEIKPHGLILHDFRLIVSFVLYSQNRLCSLYHVLSQYLDWLWG